MTYQLEKQVADRLKAFFEPFDFIDKVVIFGSRAKHNANPKSDIDLCIYSLEMSDTQFSKLKLSLDELPILYAIDIVHFEKSNEALRANVAKDGKLFFMKTLEFVKFFKTKPSKSYQIETKDYLESGKYPVVDQGQKFIVAYSDDEDKLCQIEEPVIIFGDHTRIIKYIDFDFIIGADGTKILLPFDNTINAKYAYYQLLFTKIESLGYSRHFKVLKEKTFYKPSLTKQKEIAQTLDKASELIELRKATIQKLDELAQSIFSDMFGDPVENSKKLEIKSLEEVADKITDGEHGTVERTESGKMYLMARNISKFGKLDLTDISYISEDAHNKIFKRCNAEYKDLLLVCVGATVGKCTLVPDMESFSLARSVALIKPSKEKINSNYLLHFFKTEYLQRQLKQASNTSAQAGLYTGAIKRINILVPKIEEQNKFAQIIEKIESQKSLYEAELTKLQATFDALLSQSFEG